MVWLQLRKEVRVSVLAGCFSCPLEVRRTFLNSHSEINGATQSDVVKRRWLCWSGGCLHPGINSRPKFDSHRGISILSISAGEKMQRYNSSSVGSSRLTIIYLLMVNYGPLHSLLLNSTNCFSIIKCPPFLRPLLLAFTSQVCTYAPPWIQISPQVAQSPWC